MAKAKLTKTKLTKITEKKLLAAEKAIKKAIIDAYIYGVGTVEIGTEGTIKYIPFRAKK